MGTPPTRLGKCMGPTNASEPQENGFVRKSGGWYGLAMISNLDTPLAFAAYPGRWRLDNGTHEADIADVFSGDVIE